MGSAGQCCPFCPEYLRFRAVWDELEFTSPLRFARKRQRPFRQTSGDGTICGVRKQKWPLARSGIVGALAYLSGQPLLAQLIVCFAEDLQIPIERGVGLLGPKFGRRIKDIKKEREKNKAKDRDAEER